LALNILGARALDPDCAFPWRLIKPANAAKKEEMFFPPITIHAFTRKRPIGSDRPKHLTKTKSANNSRSQNAKLRAAGPHQ